jgi:hypothetical protein
MDDTDDIVVGPADEGDDGEGTLDEVIEVLREMPVGTNDPNIVGDVGPTDVPPGTDPHAAEELLGEDDEDQADG